MGSDCIILWDHKACRKYKTTVLSAAPGTAVCGCFMHVHKQERSMCACELYDRSVGAYCTGRAAVCSPCMQIPIYTLNLKIFFLRLCVCLQMLCLAVCQQGAFCLNAFLHRSALNIGRWLCQEERRDRALKIETWINNATRKDCYMLIDFDSTIVFLPSVAEVWYGPVSSDMLRRKHLMSDCSATGNKQR